MHAIADIATDINKIYNAFENELCRLNDPQGAVSGQEYHA